MLLFSYHGIPERHIKKSACQAHCDMQQACPAMSQLNRFCYRAQCYATSHAIAEKLNLSQDQYQVSFQSRLGRTPWIHPYTDQLLPQLAQQGIKKIAVTCPSFVADCLETIEEIGLQAKQQWHDLGGESFSLIPCLNSNPSWVDAAKQIIQAYV
jgi:ferrochelatase